MKTQYETVYALDNMTYWHDGRNVRATLSDAMDIIDNDTGCPHGRLECSIDHWNYYAHAFNRPLIDVYASNVAAAENKCRESLKSDREMTHNWIING